MQAEAAIGKTMTKILMPKATAVWLIDNTSLSFEQIGVFAACIRLKFNPSPTEKPALVFKYDPVLSGQITRAELDVARRMKPQFWLSQLHICQRRIDEQRAALCASGTPR